MKIAYIGLGKMGSNMVLRGLSKKHTFFVFDPNKSAMRKVVAKGAKSAEDSKHAITQLGKGKRVIWIMVPHQFVDGVLAEIKPILKKGDIVIDGGNSPYRQSIKRAKSFSKKGIAYLDIGVSGGPNGARHGACMMVGGNRIAYTYIEKLLKDLCVKDGYGYMGPSGAGHFVKMVHNGIEYGMMQSIAEGFDIMRAKKSLKLKLNDIAKVYQHGSVIESHLMEWMFLGFNKFGEEMKGVSKRAIGTGEGKWTIEEAKHVRVRAKVLEQAYKARKYSEKKPNYQAQLIMAMRNQFGGHDIKGK